MSNAATNLPTEPAQKFLACLIDISSYFTDTEPGRELLAKCGGKLFYSGFFDDSVNTHLCSFQPSVWVEVLGIEPETYPEDDEAREELYGELLDLLTSDDDSYYLRRDIERWKVAHPDRFQEVDFDFEEDSTFDSRHDEVREGLSGNPVF